MEIGRTSRTGCKGEQGIMAPRSEMDLPMPTLRQKITSLITRRYPFLSGYGTFANSRLVRVAAGGQGGLVWSALPIGPGNPGAAQRLHRQGRLLPRRPRPQDLRSHPAHRPSRRPGTRRRRQPRCGHPPTGATGRSPRRGPLLRTQSGGASIIGTIDRTQPTD